MSSTPKLKFFGYCNVKVSWKLKNFSSEYFNNPNFSLFQSPVFRVTLSNYKVAKFKLVAVRNRNTMNIFLRKDTEDKYYDEYSNLIIYYEMKLRDFFMSELLNRAEGKIEKMFYEHKLGKCLSSKDLSRHIPHVIKDKMIEIVVLLRFIENKEESTYVNTIMSNQYEKMFNNPDYSDFKLITSENEEIFVHKLFLSARSPVFDAMINTKLLEGTEKRAKIDDIDPKSLKELIRFIYSGRVDEIDQIANELIYAAGKYELEDLKPLCVRSLGINISNDNCLNTFVLADLFMEEDLKKYTMAFIKFNYDKIKNSEQWKNLTKEQVKFLLDKLMTPDQDGSNVNLVTTITIQNSRAMQPQLVIVNNDVTAPVIPR
ncbi:hypothetical protein PVAND_013828 [Polypedilum vanderplanki]|uniref:BTB domain-containing protein n=1 Tax=Polypedilum vanderplanki TaxID=319348 RepID=A0A9J6CSQ8_POLVA|nr:hypothetical protein PVAND_013828 [Polypedilum vanderplanki]